MLFAGMRATSQRALIWVLSIAAVLVPAAGIAYLGAVSYRDERGAVAARLDAQRAAADRLADRVRAALGRALDAAAARAANPSSPAEPLAQQPFVLGPDGQVLVPSPDPLGKPEGGDAGALARAAEGCPERGLETCIRDLRAEQRRAAQLDSARRAEAECTPSVEAARAAACRARRAEARRAYQALVPFDDTGAAALFGLARLARADGDRAGAIASLHEVARRFGGKKGDGGVPLGLVADVGAAELAPGAAALIDRYRALLDRAYAGSPAALVAAAERLSMLARARATAAERPVLDALDARLAAANAGARFAAALAADGPDLARSADDSARGRPSSRDPDRTLVFRRAGTAVAGVVVDDAQLARAATDPAELTNVAPGARVVIAPTTAPPPAGARVLVTVPLGPALAHLTLAVVNDAATDPDPLDDVIHSRSRRHVALTVGLAAMLGIGLLATIRGAARERELSRLKSNFVSTVSHELKTPLTSIRMFAEMLEQGVAQGDAERTAKYHGIIVKESQRLGLLIANLLDYAQIERGTRRYQLERARVADVARKAVATFRDLQGDAAGGNEVAIEVSPTADRARALVDEDVMIQALLNLLANAAKYGGPGKPIRVTVVQPAHEVAVTVIDEGPGIPADEHERIFREFYRAPAAHAAGVEGTGLGLALVKNHVEAHGGRVTVESQPGKGAAFTIALPALDEGAAP
jgi:two-component system phosphate regulon sensor histidine kinase PhoR